MEGDTETPRAERRRKKEPFRSQLPSGKRGGRNVCSVFLNKQIPARKEAAFLGKALEEGGTCALKPKQLTFYHMRVQGEYKLIIASISVQRGV